MESKENNIVTLAHILSALRYNGFAPELEDLYHDGTRTIKFKQNIMLFRIDTTQLPYLSLGTACQIDPTKEDMDLLCQAAREVTENTFMSKVFVWEKEQLIGFQVEMFCDSYMYFRDNLKLFMDNITRTCGRYFETYDKLKEEKLKTLQKFIGALKDG